MGFWNDGAFNADEFNADAITRHVRRALGLTATFGDEGRGVACFLSFDLASASDCVSVRAHAVNASVSVPLDRFTLDMAPEQVRAVLHAACPLLAKVF